MMDRLIFDEDHEMFRDATRRFMQAEIEPHVERWRQQGRCDKEAFIKAGEQGLLCMWAEERYGGLGMEDFRFEQIVIEDGAKYFINVGSVGQPRDGENSPKYGIWDESARLPAAASRQSSPKWISPKTTSITPH